MKKEIKSVVIVPENYSIKKHYLVVYLLHGYSANYAKWVKTVPSIKSLSIVLFYNFSPYAKSPASPSPGIIYECSFSSGSIAAAQTVVFVSGK
jgi:hypothetical protein